MSLIFFFIELFQWFLIELSVLPSRTFAISAHLLLSFLWRRKSTHSSILVHSQRLLRGFRWLCHLSLQCFPSLLGSCSAISAHFWAPMVSTRWTSSVSSSWDHMAYLAPLKPSSEFLEGKASLYWDSLKCGSSDPRMWGKPFCSFCSEYSELFGG